MLLGAAPINHQVAVAASLTPTSFERTLVRRILRSSIILAGQIRLLATIPVHVVIFWMCVWPTISRVNHELEHVGRRAKLGSGTSLR